MPSPIWCSTRGIVYSTYRKMPVSTMHSQAISSRERIDLSLVRITQLLDRLSNPQANFPIIHVAGTNSKGSTIAYLDSVLSNAIGISTASFTSPHLRLERDCCKVGNEPIEEAIWEEAGKQVRQADEGFVTLPSSTSSSPSFSLNSTTFEILTARCLTAFNLLQGRRRPEVLLVEVGMGGAQDATNVFTSKQVLASVICPIDFDHQRFLGNTLSEIASQKAGIIKEGGLCILADQRRQRGPAIQDDQIDCTRVKASDAEKCLEGVEVAEIQDTVRNTCAALQARLVKAFVPWQSLSSAGPSQPVNVQSPWSAYVQSHIRYTPILMPSKIHSGDYVSSAGDPVVSGPFVNLPGTRAAMTGCHLALQTLWSMARDETPFGLGLPGSDANEELRLRIAFGLRDDRFAKKTLEECIERTNIKGRAEWLDLDLKRPSFSEMEIEQEAQQEDSPARHHLHVLVDGAHNVSAASALRRYVETCLHNRVQSSQQQEQQPAISQVTITWIFAFSQGKNVAEIFDQIFENTRQDVDQVTNDLAAARLDIQIQHKVACIPFTTPVQGMPWVQCVPADEIANVVKSGKVCSIVDVQTFETLELAIAWAAYDGDGKTVTQQGQSNLVVIAGSLYLVSDVYRLKSPL